MKKIKKIFIESNYNLFYNLNKNEKTSEFFEFFSIFYQIIQLFSLNIKNKVRIYLFILYRIQKHGIVLNYMINFQIFFLILD